MLGRVSLGIGAAYGYPGAGGLEYKLLSVIPQFYAGLEQPTANLGGFCLSTEIGRLAELGKRHHELLRY